MHGAGAGRRRHAPGGNHRSQDVARLAGDPGRGRPGPREGVRADQRRRHRHLPERPHGRAFPRVPARHRGPEHRRAAQRALRGLALPHARNGELRAGQGREVHGHRRPQHGLGQSGGGGDDPLGGRVP